jgi:hypothetical protein
MRWSLGDYAEMTQIFENRDCGREAAIEESGRFGSAISSSIVVFLKLGIEWWNQGWSAGYAIL